MSSTTLSPEALTALIERLIDHVEAECRVIDTEAAFDDMLRECYSLDKVGGPFSAMDPARVLREVDPVAYRCGMGDYTDSQSDCWAEVAGATYERSEVERARESFLDELRIQISDAEREVSELEETATEGAVDTWSAPLAKVHALIAELEAEVAAVEAHSF